MDRTRALALTRRLLQRVQSSTTDEAAECIRIPSAQFLDPVLWQREREQLFLATPQVVGFAGQLASPGSYLATESMGIPLLLTRAEDGVLRAFINACAHRGARVAAGEGDARRLTCSFHGWSYSLKGSLAGLPQAECFDQPLGQHQLVALPVSDRSGLLVVGLRPDMPQATLDRALDTIAPEFSGFGFEHMCGLETRRLEVAANWKLVVNLSHEAYHFASLHRDSLAPLMSANAIVDEFGPHSRWGFPLRNIVELESQDQSHWPELPPAAFNHTLFPGTVVVTQQRDAQVIRVEPGGDPGHAIVYYSGGCRDVSHLEQSLQAYRFGGQIFEEEDLPIAEECQRGLEAGLPEIVIGRNEPMVQFWHRCWEAALD